MEQQPVTDIINPEIPPTPQEKYELLRSCLATAALRGVIEGVTPHHVTIEGLRTIQSAQRKAEREDATSSDSGENNVY